jgi:hypothetical protein
MPLAVNAASNEGLFDMVTDNARQRLYIANSGMNRVEVFDIRTQEFLAPVKVGQLPHSLAIGTDGITLYVANSGGETISVVDLDRGTQTGLIRFTPLPFNSNAALVTPNLIAAGLQGPQVVMSNGSLWRVVGNQALPRSSTGRLRDRHNAARSVSDDGGHARRRIYLFACRQWKRVSLCRFGGRLGCGAAVVHRQHKHEQLACHDWLLWSHRRGAGRSILPGERNHFQPVAHSDRIDADARDVGAVTGVPTRGCRLRLQWPPRPAARSSASRNRMRLLRLGGRNGDFVSAAPAAAADP